MVLREQQLEDNDMDVMEVSMLVSRAMNPLEFSKKTGSKISIVEQTVGVDINIAWRMSSYSMRWAFASRPSTLNSFT